MRNSKITKIKLCLDVKNPMVKIEYFQMGIYSSKFRAFWDPSLQSFLLCGILILTQTISDDPIYGPMTAT